MRGPARGARSGSYAGIRCCLRNGCTTSPWGTLLGDRHSVKARQPETGARAYHPRADVLRGALVAALPTGSAYGRTLRDATEARCRFWCPSYGCLGLLLG